MLNWNRVLLKSEARYKLKGFFWMAFAVCVVVTLVPDMLSSFLPYPDFELMFANPDATVALIEKQPIAFFGMYFAVLFGAIVISVFIANPLYIGMYRYFLEASEGRFDFSNILYAFKNNYLNVVKVMFLKNLIIVLWSFVFIIPGIVKTYQYYFIDKQLAEDSSVSFVQAKKVSLAMTKGDKLNIFVLNLSFLGWELLGAIVCGVGVILVMPYIVETEVLLYRFKKQNYIDTM